MFVSFVMLLSTCLNAAQENGHKKYFLALLCCETLFCNPLTAPPRCHLSGGRQATEVHSGRCQLLYNLPAGHHSCRSASQLYAPRHRGRQAAQKGVCVFETAAMSQRHATSHPASFHFPLGTCKSFQSPWCISSSLFPTILQSLLPNSKLN